MERIPNQKTDGHADLMMKIERCRRLAKEVSDNVTMQKLLALAAEYEQQLAPLINSAPSDGFR